MFFFVKKYKIKFFINTFNNKYIRKVVGRIATTLNQIEKKERGREREKQVFEICFFFNKPSSEFFFFHIDLEIRESKIKKNEK